MCGSCRVTVGGKVKFACVDGPDFDGHEVDFDELIRRNAAYRAQEAVKLREWNCNLLKMKPGRITKDGEYGSKKDANGRSLARGKTSHI